jgi:hypothetical protein
MLEGMLLMLLALGGANAPSPAAAVPAATTADSVVGVWRGTWAAPDSEHRVPVEAIVTSPSKEGQLLALLATGAGGGRRMTRLTGRLEADGVRFTLPGGGSLRLAAASASRLIGVVKGLGPQASMPGDGTLELARVRR